MLRGTIYSSETRRSIAEPLGSPAELRGPTAALKIACSGAQAQQLSFRLDDWDARPGGPARRSRSGPRSPSCGYAARASMPAARRLGRAAQPHVSEDRKSVV